MDHASCLAQRLSFGLRWRRGLITVGILSGLLYSSWAVPSRAAEEADKAMVTIDASTLAKLVAAKASGSSSSSSKKKFKDFAEVTKDAKAYEGLFNLYQDDEHLYAAIKNSQLNRPFLAPITIARGMASAGMPLNFGDEWVLAFKRVDDKIQVVRKNIHYEVPSGTPIGRAVEQNYLDSVLMAIPIVSDNPPGGGVLIDLSDIFFTDFAELGLGSLDRSRTSWYKVKAFENNIELQVQATYRGGSYGRSYDDGVVDPRGVTVVLHYSLANRPAPGYRSRLADQRVGHFINATKDFASDDPDTDFIRRINRWRIEKANPSSKVSPPKKQIVWWVENTVPHEYRPYVEEGILEWNKAFEKIGIRNALGVRWQQEGDEFEPEDINYCTFRWVTTPYTFAMSGLRSDPISGEMIDGDVVFDASWIRYWKQEYAFLVGMPYPTGQEASATPALWDIGEVISPMLAAKQGYGLPGPCPSDQFAGVTPEDARSLQTQVVPSSWSPLQTMLSQRLSAGRNSSCRYGLAKRQEFRLAALAMAARSQAVAEDTDEATDSAGDEAPAEESTEGTDEKADEKPEDDKADEKKEEEKAEKKEEKPKPAKLPEEFIGQMIKDVVMHEVGHSLGLRHNFRASTMLTLDEVNNKEITHDKGMIASVMDYTPVNIALDPEKQGDYATTTIGPYDYWAIEYAYKPINGNEKKELDKIAARSPEHDLAYATDEDLGIGSDPRVQVYDLGDDALAFARLRMQLADKLLKGLDDKVVEDGDSWARLRSAFNVLISQYGDASYLASSCIAGQHIAKHHKAKGVEDPIVPVPGDRQREALELLTERIFSDGAFQYSPQTLRRLTRENWTHWGSRYSTAAYGYPVYNTVLQVQKIALDHCLDASTLTRLQNQQLLAEDENPLKMDELFRTLTDSIWSELSTPEEDSEKLEISTIRRNLQREHLKRLSTIVVGAGSGAYSSLYAFITFSSSGGYPADAKSLARLHLRELGDKIDSVLKAKGQAIDDVTRAHLQEAADQIKMVLEADLQASGP